MIINYDVNNKGGGGNSFSLENLGYKTFNENDWFDEGEVVIHDNQLFQFTTGHCGEWSDSDTYLVTVEELIENAKVDVSHFVSFLEYQILTSSQKQRARTNIGAAAEADIQDMVRFGVRQYLSDSQMQQARENIEACSKSEVVRYDRSQDLDPVYQQQARTNIGAAAEADIQDMVRYGRSQSLTAEQKRQARLNIGAAEPLVVSFDSLTTLDNMTFAQVSSITSAVNNGKPCVAKFGNSYVYCFTAIASRSIAGEVEAYLLDPMGGKLHRIHYNINYSRYTHEVFPLGKHSVVYNEAQTLTDAQKQQARTNIGAGTSNLTDAPSDNKQYARCNGEWEEVEAGGGEAVQADWNETDSTDPAFIKNKPAIPQTENHQLLKAALSEPMGCQADTWQTLCELSVPESGVYQVSASARMLPADQSTAYKTATVSIEAGTDAAGYTEVMEMTLPRSGEYGTMSVPVNATAGQKLRLRAISDANFYAQASPSAGKASATFIAAVRIGATYQAQ